MNKNEMVITESFAALCEKTGTQLQDSYALAQEYLDPVDPLVNKILLSHAELGATMKAFAERARSQGRVVPDDPEDPVDNQV